MRKYIVITAALSTLSFPAFATNPGHNNGGTPTPTTTTTNGGGTPTPNIGGAGGLGGSAIQGQVQGQAQGQSSVNRNANTATGGSAASNATSGSTSRGGDQGQNQQNSVDNRGAGSNSNNYQQSGIPVSSAVAPSFAIGGCQWAVSGGIQFFGTGVSGGGAGMYEFCKALMKASHFRNDGNRNDNVAKALECQDGGIRAAYKTAGQPCQEDMPRQVAAANGNGASSVVPVLSKPALAPNCTEKTVSGKTFVTCN